MTAPARGGEPDTRQADSRPVLLEVRGLGVTYGDAQALWDVSLTVLTGAVVALLGGNGAGKTSTLRAISGLVAPRAGSVRLGGTDLGGLAPHAIVALGLSHIPEGRHLWPAMTVHENLRLGAFPRAARPHLRESLDRVLELFPRLRERRGQAAGTLSGGEQQMLAIGRALMARPRLLMLDEPSLGLAPRVVAELFETIAAVNQAGVTILLVEQNARQALALADHGYVLETGRVALSGPPGTLLADPHVQEAYLGL